MIKVGSIVKPNQVLMLHNEKPELRTSGITAACTMLSLIGKPFKVESTHYTDQGVWYCRFAGYSWVREWLDLITPAQKIILRPKC